MHHSGFVLGEAHSLLLEDFIVNLDSDNESFHSAESSTEIDKLANENAQTVTIENEHVPTVPNGANEDGTKADELAVPSDEMEVTTTVQDCIVMTIDKHFSTI